MKAVKAYIRCEKAEEVVSALVEKGIRSITLINVMGMGLLADPHTAKYSMECVEQYSKVAKLEIVCSDDRVHEIVETIRSAAYTGLKGDGMIYVTPVEMAIKIRSGAIGEEAV